jgi:hypothetical protein
MSILITGKTGFIGSRLTAELSQRQIPFTAVGREELPRVLSGGTLLHLANVHGSVGSNVQLTAEILKYAKERNFSTVIFVQSFASLTGKSDFNPHSINLGFSPRVLDVYSAGKLGAESYAIKTTPSDVRLVFVYLPAVLGYGGSWNRLFQQLLQHRTLRVPLVSTARANHISINEVVDRFVTLLTTPSLIESKVTRQVWSSPASRHTLWPDFLNQHLDQHHKIECYLPWLRFSESALKNIVCGVTLSRGLPNAIRERIFSFRGTGNSKGVSSPIWEPGPFLRFLMCEQSYIPPLSVVQ